MGKRKRFAYPPHSFVNVNTSPAARVGMRLKRMESRCSLIFHLCGTYQSTLLPLSALASGQDPHHLFISATVDLCEGGCWRESEKALPPAPSQHQSCHFSNYLKQSFPSPALHYLAVSPLSLSSSWLSSLFLCSFTRPPSSYSHRPIIWDTFQLRKIQSERVAEHQRPNKNPQTEGELSAVTSVWAGCPQLTLSDFFFAVLSWI